MNCNVVQFIFFQLIFLSLLQVLANRGVLADVSLVVEGKTVQAHKVLLAAASDYFAAMFTGSMMESEMETVELQGLEFSALQLLVDYCYSGQPKSELLR
jgi:hypothetical protein